ncbi:phytanoyl-CoA dioxygenase family protein [Angustibacter sp. Root456]|uniref:phytanoyl-CoA dioxygenase family protein n=1 Tax=Angustibacter sp. Root456 TaxID=1736539 RepID=UPI0006FDA0A0|nr:phytanoyl-CoA dioxygenase family protein [Angustibacter sp. Root456]KQX69817.1 phytanoyl-CoA dioxygenase [Angustibacter sp. Root456]
MTYWTTRTDVAAVELAELTSLRCVRTDYPSCIDVREGIPVYDGSTVPPATRPAQRRALMTEVGDALLNGPGIVCFAGAYRDLGVIDAVSEVFFSIIHEQDAQSATVGDHFGTPGANARVWNSLEKLARRDARLFAEYFANDVVAFASEAWLGPGYQVTTQVNLVRPGGAAQTPHRDYHLGFIDDLDTLERYPTHVHRLSAALTLQGAVAHSDVPLESGPTVFVPHSQKYLPGYLATSDPAVADVIAAAAVQVPFAKGDAVFFNPAVIHGAGTNRTTDVERLVNLLQVSSAFGRSTEAVDRLAVTTAVYPALLAAQASGAPWEALANAVAAATEGYAFPTNLDRDPPVDGLAPASQRALVLRALEQQTPADVLTEQLVAHAERRVS